MRCHCRETMSQMDEAQRTSSPKTERSSPFSLALRQLYQCTYMQSPLDVYTPRYPIHPCAVLAALVITVITAVPLPSPCLPIFPRRDCCAGHVAVMQRQKGLPSRIGTIIFGISLSRGHMAFSSTVM